MPVPKRRHSKARGRKRRTHWKLDPPNLTHCPHCHKPKLPHHICPQCGWYAGREVVVAEKKEKK